ncbi:helix-turn-helix transcriptional regulator [Kitasatospora purpeofusca]|uniref:helix-turn-helix transcriptional regulator n=1 Tax=Kitasatospora purpeofusca TaxID=67352 RepID=UPI0034019DC3
MNHSTTAAAPPDAHDERVYRALLTAPGLGVAELASACVSISDSVRTSLGRLQALGIVTRTGPDAFRATDPQTALDHLDRHPLRSIENETRRVAAAHRLLKLLVAEQRTHADEHAGPRRLPDGVEMVHGLDRILDCVDDLSFCAREERLTTHPGPIITTALDTVQASDRRHLRRGLRMRTIVHTTALADEQVNAHADDLTAQGARLRCTDRALDRIVVFDRHTALIAADPHDITRTTLIVRHPGLVAQLLSLFEHHWERAHRLRAPRPGTAEQAVLQTMALVGTDEVGARSLGISVRTYRRHVAQLLRRLGADNRFQAALLAREQNWI